MRALIIVSWAIILCSTVATGVAYALPQEVTCSGIWGQILAAPEWNGVPDGYKGQSVTLTSFPENSTGRVAWSNGLKEDGAAVPLASGFAIIAVGDSWIETYIVNVSSMELMMTAIRSGSSTFPNSTRAFHGTCRPGQ